MTANDRFESQLEGWLRAEGSTPAPADLHDIAIDRARRSRQRPGWLVAARGTTFDGSSWSIDVSRHRVAYGVIAVALLLGLVGAAILAGAFRTEPTKLGVNGGIIYSVGDAAGLHVGDSVRLIGADGSGDTRIASGTCPRFASGRSVIAYGSPSGDLVVADVSDGRVTASHTIPGIARSDYALSADGTRIAWVEYSMASDIGTARSDLYVGDVGTGTSVRILSSEDRSNELWSKPAWSPDGRRIGFVRTYFATDVDGTQINNRLSIALVDADGSDLHDITNRPGWSDEFSWSPDGQWIAFLGYPDAAPYPGPGEPTPPEDIFVVAADGTHARPLTRTDADESNPVWSPDGRHIAYLTFGQEAALTTVRMDAGSTAGAPVNGPAVDAFAWSPDGTRLVILNQTVVDTQLTGGTISTIDADLRTPPAVVRALNFPITCSPTWQRLDQ